MVWWCVARLDFSSRFFPIPCTFPPLPYPWLGGWVSCLTSKISWVLGTRHFWSSWACRSQVLHLLSRFCSCVNCILKRLLRIPWRYRRSRRVVAFLVLSTILALMPNLLPSVTPSTLILWCEWCIFVDTSFTDILDIIATFSAWLNVNNDSSTSSCTCLETVLTLGTLIWHNLHLSTSFPSLSKCWWSRALW